MSHEFDDMMNDQVTLTKPDGTRIEGIKANVTSKGITTFQGALPIEDGDTIERERPGGITERFTVLDAGYHREFHGIPAHFQMKVRKETGVPNPSLGPSQYYYLNGPNARVNNQSIDASVNISNAQAASLFDELRHALLQVVDETERETILVLVDKMEQNLGSPSFLEKYQAFIQSAANHMTIVAPYLPALAQLLTK